ncbi:MAG: sulfotransferase domain-containing protein [Roseivirga sp.]|nr:sulfotransferase domain-containing protein [Roseivirga sp.]
MHNHYLFHPRFGRAIGILRDGRDIAVSAYYHFLHENDRNPKAMVAMHRKALPFSDYDDIRTNLPEFIHYLFEVYSQGVTHSSWSDHVRSCLGSTSVCVVKYEDLLAKPSKELIKACEFLNEKPDLAIIDEVINNHSFASKSKRKPGDENSASFLRKGIAGDWKNHFSIESCQVFNKFGGKELIMAGYESDDSWIKNWVE